MAKRIYTNKQQIEIKMTRGGDLENLPEGQELPEPSETITLTDSITLYGQYWAVYDEDEELLYLQERE